MDYFQQSRRHSQFLLDLLRERLAINTYMSVPVVPRAIWQPIHRFPPMSDVKHQVHRRRRQVLLLTVVTNRRRHWQLCHSPYLAFPSSSSIRQARKPSRTHLRLTLNSRILCRPPSNLEWNVSLKMTMQIVALLAGLLVSGYLSHLILPTFANVLWTCDPIQFHAPRFVGLSRADQTCAGTFFLLFI